MRYISCAAVNGRDVEDWVKDEKELSESPTGQPQTVRVAHPARPVGSDQASSLEQQRRVRKLAETRPYQNLSGASARSGSIQPIRSTRHYETKHNIEAGTRA